MTDKTATPVSEAPHLDLTPEQLCDHYFPIIDGVDTADGDECDHAVIVRGFRAQAKALQAAAQEKAELTANRDYWKVMYETVSSQLTLTEAKLISFERN